MKTLSGLGAAFYPEQQEEELRVLYMDMLQKSGFRFVRFGEFTWNILEPEDGLFDFTFHDRIIQQLADRGISVIIGTPTAAPPKWACMKYDLFLQKENDEQMQFGSRRYICPNAKDFRFLAQRITKAMAEHYAGNPNIIGWQVDNEVGHPFCYCPQCLALFQEFCRKKFGTIETFNRRICSAFWGQSLNRFEEITFPTEYLNPGLKFLYHKFFSESVCSCYGDLSDTIRKYCPDVPVSTNYMITWYAYDHEKMSEKLDFTGGDYYFGNGPFGEDLGGVAFASAYLRGLKKEAPAGFLEYRGGRTTETPYPGELRYYTLGAFACGMDYINYFRFDNCPGGAERDNFGIVRHPANPGRSLPEITETVAEWRKIEQQIGKSKSVSSQTALLFSFDTQFDFAEYPPDPSISNLYHCGYSCQIYQHFRALLRAGETPEVVFPHGNFSDYKLIIASALRVIPDFLAEKIREYIYSGGIFLMLPYSGIYDEDVYLASGGAPAGLHDVFALSIADYGKMTRRRVMLESEFYPSYVIHWLDEIIPRENCSIHAWAFNPETGLRIPAVSEAPYGTGKACYWGACPEAEDLLADCYKIFYRKNGLILPNSDLKNGELCFRRIGEGKTIVFTFNQDLLTCNYKIE